MMRSWGDAMWTSRRAQESPDFPSVPGFLPKAGNVPTQPSCTTSQRGSPR